MALIVLGEESPREDASFPLNCKSSHIPQIKRRKGMTIEQRYDLPVSNAMNPIIRRLKQLEYPRQMQIARQSSGVRERIMAELDRIRERMMAGGDWPPVQPPDCDSRSIGAVPIDAPVIQTSLLIALTLTAGLTNIDLVSQC